jgi:hypothetical protein
MAKTPWKPWHEVVALREDLKSGELPLHMFAADLYEVMMQSGKRPIYEDPERFFALTFPTYNLRQLVRDVVLRVAGKNDKAVRQLELTYGGGKTHTLITLRHLVTDPDNLPDMAAVHEFRQAIGQAPPRARVAGLCFDKLDVETGMEVRGPNGETQRLVQPWSILAYQLAGEAGLRVLNAGKSTAERESAPAENTLTELLELPVKEGLGVLILIDEVLMYVREKVSADRKWRDRMINFFQYLTQAATKVDRAAWSPRCWPATRPRATRLVGSCRVSCTTSSSVSVRKPSSRWPRRTWRRYCAAVSSPPRRSRTKMRSVRMCRRRSRASARSTSRPGNRVPTPRNVS